MTIGWTADDSWHNKSINEDSKLICSKQLGNLYEDNNKNSLSKKRKHISCSIENYCDYQDDLSNKIVTVIIQNKYLTTSRKMSLVMTRMYIVQFILKIQIKLLIIWVLLKSKIVITLKIGKD